MNSKFYIFSIFALFTLLSSQIEAQVNVKDSACIIPMIYATYSYQAPEGDLIARFGNNSSIGAGFAIKTKSNWILGAEGNFIFGDQVKDEASILQSISTQDGFIIDGNGGYAEVHMYERGVIAMVKLGKVFSFKCISPNPNSGILITAGGGFLQHKIRIENPGNTAPQIKGDYRKGYDKLTNGIAASEFIGYMYFGNHRLVSFFAGIEFTQALTRARRDYDFSLQKKDLTKRFDLLTGIKIGWIIPLYRQSTPKFYYY